MNENVKKYSWAGIALLALSGIGYTIYRYMYKNKSGNKIEEDTKSNSNKESNSKTISKQSTNTNNDSNNTKSNTNEGINNEKGNLNEIYDIQTFSYCLKSVLNHCFDSICVFTTSIKKLEKEIQNSKLQSQPSPQTSENEQAAQDQSNHEINVEIGNFFRTLEYEKARIINAYGLNINYYNKSLDYYKNDGKL